MPPLVYIVKSIWFYFSKPARLNLSQLKYIPRERIVCAANRLKDGTLILGVRHLDFLMRDTAMIAQITDDELSESEEGFINQRGEFLTRKQAWIVAFNANQIVRRVGGDEGILYSENLY